MTYAPIYPHDPIEEIATDTFLVRGSIRMNALMRITRNMVIVREDAKLTLINPVRLDAAGEARLNSLGTVTNVLRLGPLHGLDDPYYVDQFGAKMWCQSGGTTYPGPPIDHALSETSELPFGDAEIFCFETTKQPECLLRLKRDKTILLSCDSIQHYGDYRHNNFFARTIMPFIGFPKTTIVGPLWLKFMTPDGGSLKDEFERLLQWDFDALVSAHGSFLADGGHAAVRTAVNKAFPD